MTILIHQVIIFVLLALLLWMPCAHAAITVTNLETSGVNNAAGSSATASISPSANKLIIECVFNEVASGTPNQPTVSGNGLTWVLVATATQGLNRTSMFRAMGASPSAGAVTTDYSAQTQASASWSVFEIGGINTGGSNGSAAVVQSSTGNTTVAGTSVAISPDLAAFAGGGNATLACIASNQNIVLTSEGGYTDVAQNSGVGSRILSSYLASPDTTVGGTGASNSMLLVIGAEISVTSARKRPLSPQFMGWLPTDSIRPVNFSPRRNQ